VCNRHEAVTCRTLTLAFSFECLCRAGDWGRFGRIPEVRRFGSRSGVKFGCEQFRIQRQADVTPGAAIYRIPRRRLNTRTLPSAWKPISLIGKDDHKYLFLRLYSVRVKPRA